MRNPFLSLAVVLGLMLSPKGWAGDWPTLGGSNARNMVVTTPQNVPTNWDKKAGINVRWTAKLGSQTYGNPAVSQGKVLVGTNNAGAYDPAITGDRGNLLCFSEKDGSFLWQAVHDKLASGAQNDWPLQGVASTPAIDGDHVYYVNNRAELVCLDIDGFADGNDGFKGEPHQGPKHADILWTYDMIKELGVFPHNLANASPLVLGDWVYTLTGNGVSEDHKQLPAPNAPDFIAVHKKTGKLGWKAKTAQPVFHGQWSSPAAGKVQGKDQLFFGGGDGWLYGFSPDGKALWRVDTNPKDATWEVGGSGTRNAIIATPVIYEGHLYVAGGDDPEYGSGPGNLVRIDPTGTGDLGDKAKKWMFGGDAFGRSLSTVAIHKGLVYITSLDGLFYCVDQATGAEVWQHDLFAQVWGSPLAVDDRIYIGDLDGDVCILGQGRTKTEIGEINLGSAIYTTPAVANGTLFIATNTQLFAIGSK